MSRFTAITWSFRLFFGGQQASFLLSAWPGIAGMADKAKHGTERADDSSRAIVLAWPVGLVGTDIDLKKGSTSKDTQCIEPLN
jgi:hypothetical protein